MEYAVAGAKLFAPIWQACERIYTTIDKSKTFGHRFAIEKRSLNASYVVFVSLGEIRRDQLLEPLNEHDLTETSRMRAIEGLLINARDIMVDCEKLIQEVAKSRYF